MLKDQHWFKEAFASVRDATAGHNLSAVCKALLSKAIITSSNSNSMEVKDSSLVISLSSKLYLPMCIEIEV